VRKSATKWQPEAERVLVARMLKMMKTMVRRRMLTMESR